MDWRLPWQQRAAPAEAGHSGSDAWQRHVGRLAAAGIPEPGTGEAATDRTATRADEATLYHVNPSFADLLPWAE